MLNENYYNKIKSRWDGLLKPLDALGTFEEISCEMGAILSDEDINIFPAALIVFISDNGIIAEGVAQSDETVTKNVACVMSKQISSVCHMAKTVGIDVFPVNLGMKYSDTFEGIDNSFYITAGTQNFANEPAMTRPQCDRALEAGKSYVRKLKNDGYRCILLGEMGIGNTTTSAAVIASLLGIAPQEVCGRGSGLSDEGLSHKTLVIENAIKKYNITNADPYEVLCTVGGYDIVAMVGVIIEAYNEHIPVVLDGVITAAAALCSYKLMPDIKDVIFFSHKGREKGIMTVAEYLKKPAVIDGSLALGEGTGAVMFMSLLKTALAIYKGNTTFADVDMESYKRFV